MPRAQLHPLQVQRDQRRALQLPSNCDSGLPGLRRPGAGSAAPIDFKDALGRRAGTHPPRLVHLNRAGAWRVPHTVVGTMIEVTVAGLGIAPPSSVPLLLLKERTGERVLPVGIGPLEAQAIVIPLQGVQPPRPLTHDIFVEIISSLGGHLRRVEITELIDSTFHARLMLESMGQERSYDIRPSDAVALAVRTETPIFVAEAVFDQAGIVSPQLGEGAAPEGSTTSPGGSVEIDESKLTPFKEFIESLDIDDLGQSGGGPEKKN